MRKDNLINDMRLKFVNFYKKGKSVIKEFKFWWMSDIFSVRHHLFVQIQKGKSPPKKKFSDGDNINNAKMVFKRYKTT